MRPTLVLLSLATLALVTGCSDGKSAGGACSSNTDCDPGEVCLDSGCMALCQADLDCDAGEICGGESVCTAGTRADLPLIEAVDGDGSLDGTTGQAAHHFGFGLIVDGNNLDGAGFSLTPDSGGATVELAVRAGRTAQRVELDLPTDLTSGTYLLQAVNGAGAAQTGVTILQGEPGPAGSDANVTGTAVIGALEAYTGNATIPYAVLPTGGGAAEVAPGNHDHAGVYLDAGGAPGLTGDVHRLDVRSIGLDFPGASTIGRRVALDGTDEHSGGRGLNLVVIDRATMTVDSSTTYDTHVCDTTTGAPVNAINMRDALAALDESKIVVVTAYDSFVSCFTTSGIEDELKRVGASDMIDMAKRVLPGETSAFGHRAGYLLVGIPGIGAGNGIEMFQPDSAEGYVETSVLVFDGVPAGLGASNAQPTYPQDQCTVVSGPCGADVSTQSSNAYVDRIEGICPEGHYLAGINFNRCGASSSGMLVALTCCR